MRMETAMETSVWCRICSISTPSSRISSASSGSLSSSRIPISNCSCAMSSGRMPRRSPAVPTSQRRWVLYIVCVQYTWRLNHIYSIQKKKRKKQIEQVANVITHGIWILPAVFAAIKLFERSSSASQYLVAWVYGGALCMLFTVSTFFHCSCYCAEHKWVRTQADLTIWFVHFCIPPLDHRRMSRPGPVSAGRRIRVSRTCSIAATGRWSMCSSPDRTSPGSR